jgi:hypothetical protein
MIETAFLCLFVYAPVMMMVIIWGDMSLDKERAHVAAAYMAFARQPMTDAELVDQFFPGATGERDATHSVRNVAVLQDETADGPVYTLPQSSDYPGGEPPPHDLQYRLYSLGVGELHVLIEIQFLPDGRPAFVARVEHDDDDVSRYLTQNEIVNVGGWPTDPIVQPIDDGDIRIDTDANAGEYTYYVKTLTDLFNGEWNAGAFPAGGAIGNAAPTMESTVALRTRFQSPFLSDLERSDFGVHEGPDLNLPRIGGEPGFEMQFGPDDSGTDDDSFRTGYTYVRNSAAQLDLVRLRTDLYELSDVIFDRDGRQIHQMPQPLSGEAGPEHTAFLTPGDPRL